LKGLRGFSDVGFSSHTVPTYCPVSEYFGLRAKAWVLMPKDIRQGVRALFKAMPKGFWVSGFSFQPSILRGARVHV